MKHLLSRLCLYPLKRAWVTATCTFVLGLCALSSTASAHPLDGLTAQEYLSIQKILKDAKLLTPDTLFPLIELQEPPKDQVLQWRSGDKLDRKALVQYTSNGGFKEAIVNITQKKVERDSLINEQPMVLFAEFMNALQGVLSDPAMIAGLQKRHIQATDAFCLPLTAGNFFTEEYKNARLMKVPCYHQPSGSNYYARPIEGLFAMYDIGKKKVIKVLDTGVVPLPTDNWGYTEAEVAQRTPLRPKTNPVKMTQVGQPNYKLKGSHLEWDMWRLNFRVDKRPGLVVSNIDVNDRGTWRSVIYQAHLSEVFVPYMDPSEGWYWRTYMDSGEYGFGLFLSPLKVGLDCPSYATYMPAVIADDKGQPLVLPNAICIFERNIANPAWRHFEILAQGPKKFTPTEGRPATELIIRTNSEVGNYDYFIDYRLQQNGQLNIDIGASGLDAVKGVAAASMDDPTAKADTKHGTLIAPHLAAANHDHYFNFMVDFDIDQPINHFSTMDVVPAKIDPDSPRKSMWTVAHSMPNSEMEARYKINTSSPRYFHISNPSRKGYLGHEPAYMIHHGDVAYGPFDFQNDPPMKRNAYIEYSVWNTVYNPDHRYAGGKYAMQSDGSDTLAEWVKADQSLMNKDIVTWFTAGFHHIPRMEDWPVMSTEWKTVHIMPFNFFQYNPALTVRSK